MYDKIKFQIKTLFNNRYTVWEKCFILSAFILLGYTLTNFTPLTLGGWLLIIGTFFTYQGLILLSVLCFIIADTCWITNAIATQDYQGALFIAIGITLSILATIKINSGKMKTDLN